jgi:hypothetical protein
MKKLELNQMTTIQGGGHQGDCAEQAAKTVLLGAFGFVALTFVTGGAFAIAAGTLAVHYSSNMYQTLRKCDII